MFASGSPRRLQEAVLEDVPLEFLGRPKPVGVHILVSREEAKKRLLFRKRGDDTETSIERRLDWFDKDVMPIIEYYRKDGRLIEVDGEGAPEKIFNELLEKLEKYFSRK